MLVAPSTCDIPLLPASPCRRFASQPTHVAFLDGVRLHPPRGPRAAHRAVHGSRRSRGVLGALLHRGDRLLHRAALRPGERPGAAASLLLADVAVVLLLDVYNVCVFAFARIFYSPSISSVDRVAANEKL